METSGTNLTNGTIKIGDVVADDRIRVGGILYLREKLGKPFEQVATDMSDKLNAKDVDSADILLATWPLLVAVILQRNPDFAEADADAILKQLDLNEYLEVFQKLEIFTKSAAKNAQAPASAKPRTRKKVVRKPRP